MNLCTATPRTIATGEYECPNCGSVWEKSDGDVCPNAPKLVGYGTPVLDAIEPPTPAGPSIAELITDGYLPPLPADSHEYVLNRPELCAPYGGSAAIAEAVKENQIRVEQLATSRQLIISGDLYPSFAGKITRTAIGQILQRQAEDSARYRKLVEMLKVGAVLLPHGPRAEEHLRELLG